MPEDEHGPLPDDPDESDETYERYHRLWTRQLAESHARQEQERQGIGPFARIWRRFASHFARPS